MVELFRVLTALGIGAIGLGVLLVINREAIRSKILRKTSAKHSYYLTRLIIWLVFLIAVIAICAGLIHEICWTGATEQRTKQSKEGFLQLQTIDRIAKSQWFDGSL